MVLGAMHSLQVDGEIALLPAKRGSAEGKVEERLNEATITRLGSIPE
jgi:hypothetical protein